MGERRVAVIPVFQDKRATLPRVVLITSRRRGEWILPTGKHEKGKGDRSVAESEAFEEAGLIGRLERGKPGHLRIRRGSGRRQDLTLFCLQVRKLLNRWPERKQRKRTLVAAADLHRYLKDPNLIKQLRRRLKH